MRRKLLLVAAVLVLVAPLVFVLATPALRGALHARLIARRLRSEDKETRIAARKKLLEIGQPAIDGVLPELVFEAFRDSYGQAFVGTVSWHERDRTAYDLVEILPEKAQGRISHPGILVDGRGDGSALGATSARRQLVLQSGFNIVFAVDLDSEDASTLVESAREAVRLRPDEDPNALAARRLRVRFNRALLANVQRARATSGQ